MSDPADKLEALMGRIAGQAGADRRPPRPRAVDVIAEVIRHPFAAGGVDDLAAQLVAEIETRFVLIPRAAPLMVDANGAPLNAQETAGVMSVWFTPESAGQAAVLSLEVLGGQKLFRRLWLRDWSLDWGWRLPSSAIRLWSDEDSRVDADGNTR